MTEFWTDHLGVVRPVPQSKRKFGKRHPRFAALIAYVFIMAGFTCCRCGAKPHRVPHSFDGTKPVAVFRGKARFWLVVDHVLSRLNGGTNHPDNLQALCSSCNAKKAGREDAKHPAAVERRRRASES